MEDICIAPKHWALYELNGIITLNTVLFVRTTANSMALGVLDIGKYISARIISANLNI
jgi:hypothetical protein